MIARRHEASVHGWSIASVSNHTVLANGALLDADQQPIVYRANLTPVPMSKGRRRKVLWRRLMSRLSFTRPKRMERLTWLFRPNSGNYFHWTIEVLPKLWVLAFLNWKEPIAVDRHLLERRWVREVLELFPDLNFFFFHRHQEIRVETLFLVDEGDFATRAAKKALSSQNAMVLKGMREFMLASLKAKSTGKRPSRLHISRQREKRKIANIGEARKVLDKFGFEDVYLQDLSLADQVFLMSNADAVFAPHGAGLVNTIFMKEGAKVLELKHARKYEQDGTFQGLSRPMGVSYHFLEVDGAEGRNDDFHVDPAQLEKKLAEIIGAS